MSIKKDDVFRATLADHSGNIGYVGLAPDGSRYHVVAPVDLQLARSVKAGLQPEDGTPFGGYKDWNYFECLPYDGRRSGARRKQAAANARLLSAWAADLGIRVEIVD